MTRPSILSLGLLIGTLGACAREVETYRAPIVGADALWGGADFCARTTAGLACWNPTGSRESERTPVVVSGLANVRNVVSQIGNTCALHDGGISCFERGDSTSTKMAFDAPTQLVEVGGASDLLCALEASGVSCWNHDAPVPRRRVELDTPKRLFAGYDVLCGVYDYGTRCYPVTRTGAFEGGVSLPGVHDPRSVSVSVGSGYVLVVDGAQALFGEFAGTFEVGNPFAQTAPLDVDFRSRPFVGAAVVLRPVPDVGPVRATARLSITNLVLDDRSVAAIEIRGGKAEVTRWTTDLVPSALFTGDSQSFYSAEGTELRQHGWDRGHRTNRLVAGIARAKHVVAGISSTCVLDETGGVACARNPPL